MKRDGGTTTNKGKSKRGTDRVVVVVPVKVKDWGRKRSGVSVGFLWLSSVSSIKKYCNLHAVSIQRLGPAHLDKPQYLKHAVAKPYLESFQLPLPFLG